MSESLAEDAASSGEKGRRERKRGGERRKKRESDGDQKSTLPASAVPMAGRCSRL
jgi:hypothetical protein